MSIALDPVNPGHEGADLRPSNPLRIELLRQLNRSRSKFPFAGWNDAARLRWRSFQVSLLSLPMVRSASPRVGRARPDE